MSWDSFTTELRIRELERQLEEFRETTIPQDIETVGITNLGASGRGLGTNTGIIGPISYPFIFNPIESRRFDAEPAPGTASPNVSNTLFVNSTSITLTPKTSEDPIEIRVLDSTLKNGQIILITVKDGAIGRLLVPNGTEGNINISANIDFNSTRVLFLQWRTNSALATSSNGSWVVISDSTGGGGGAIVPNGTIENEHLEWDNAVTLWKAVQSMTFGATGPFGDSGFLRFPSNQIIVSARNTANTGNVELKLNGANVLDITESANNSVALQLRAQNAVNPDASFSIIQTPHVSGSGGTTLIDTANSSSISVSADGVGFWVFDGDAVTNKSLQNIDMGNRTIFDWAGLDQIGAFSNGSINFINNSSIRWKDFAGSSEGILRFTTSDRFSFSHDIDMLTNNILAGGAGEGVTNIGHLDFVDNLATPAATFSIYSDGTNLLANTGSHVTNLDALMENPAVADLDMATFDILNLDQLNQEATGAVLIHTFARPETLADSTTIGEIRFRAFDGLGTINNYASIRGIMRSDVNTGEDGILQFYVAEAGVHDVLYMEINGNNNLEFVQFHKKIQMSADLRMGGNNLVFDTDLDTSIDSVTDDNMRFITGGVLRGSWNNTALIVENNFTVNGGLILLGNSLVNDRLNITARLIKKHTWELTSNDVPLSGELAIGRDSLGNMKITVPATEHIGLQVAASDIVRIFSDRVEFNDPIIFPISAGALGATQFGISRNGSEMQINTDATFKVLVDAVEVAQFGSSFLQFPEVVSDPAAGTTSGKFYVKTVGGLAKPFFIGDGTAAVDLSSGGGSQTPWTSNIDADGFSLQDLNNLEFRDDATSPAATVAYINKTATDMNFNVPTSDGFLFKVAASQSMGISSSVINMFKNVNMQGNDITGFDTIQGSATSEILMVGGFIDMGDGEIRDADDITMHGNSRILSVGTTEFGIQIDNATATVGTFGMLAMPITSLSPTTIAQLDTAFGNHLGAMGFDSGLLERLWIKVSNTKWVGFDFDASITS